MKVTINVKLVNSKFNQAYADKENDGFETEDNIRFLWEDEFEIQGMSQILKWSTTPLIFKWHTS